MLGSKKVKKKMEDKLLAILDMTEEEQYAQCCKLLPEYNLHNSGKSVYSRQRELAYLAFRMRDEAKSLNSWGKAKVLVWKRVEWKKADPFSPMKFEVWWDDFSQPIHWIVAALIAKEELKDE